MSAVLAEVEAVFSQRRADQLARYRALVVDVVDGKKTATQEVVAILDSVGRTPSQLTADSALLRQRREWRAKEDAAPLQQQRSAELNVEITKLREKFKQDSKRLSDELEATVHPLQLERDRLSTAFDQAGLHDYRSKLLESGDGYEAAKEVWGNFPNQKHGEQLKKDLQAAQVDLRHAERELRELEERNSRKLPLIEARLKTGPAEEKVRRAKAAVQAVENKIAADDAAWAAHKERAKVAEDRLKIPENFKLAV